MLVMDTANWSSSTVGNSESDNVLVPIFINMHNIHHTLYNFLSTIYVCTRKVLKKVQQNAEKIGCALFSYLDIQHSGLTWYYVMTKCFALFKESSNIQ